MKQLDILNKLNDELDNQLACQGEKIAVLHEKLRVLDDAETIVSTPTSVQSDRAVVSKNTYEVGFDYVDAGSPDAGSPDNSGKIISAPRAVQGDKNEVYDDMTQAVKKCMDEAPDGAVLDSVNHIDIRKLAHDLVRSGLDDVRVNDVGGKKIRVNFSNTNNEALTSLKDVLGQYGLSDLMGRLDRQSFNKNGEIFLYARSKVMDETPDGVVLDSVSHIDMFKLLDDLMKGGLTDVQVHDYSGNKIRINFSDSNKQALPILKKVLPHYGLSDIVGKLDDHSFNGFNGIYVYSHSKTLDEANKDIAYNDMIRHPEKDHTPNMVTSVNTITDPASAVSDVRTTYSEKVLNNDQPMGSDKIKDPDDAQYASEETGGNAISEWKKGEENNLTNPTQNQEMQSINDGTNNLFNAQLKRTEDDVTRYMKNRGWSYEKSKEEYLPHSISGPAIWEILDKKYSHAMDDADVASPPVSDPNDIVVPEVTQSVSAPIEISTVPADGVQPATQEQANDENAVAVKEDYSLPETNSNGTENNAITNYKEGLEENITNVTQSMDAVRELIDQFNDHGRIAVLYRKKGCVLIDGCTLPILDAVTVMQRMIDNKVLDGTDVRSFIDMPRGADDEPNQRVSDIIDTETGENIAQISSEIRTVRTDVPFFNVDENKDEDPDLDNDYAVEESKGVQGAVETKDESAMEAAIVDTLDAATPIKQISSEGDHSSDWYEVTRNGTTYTAQHNKDDGSWIVHSGRDSLGGRRHNTGTYKHYKDIDQLVSSNKAFYGIDKLLSHKTAMMDDAKTLSADADTKLHSGKESIKDSAFMNPMRAKRTQTVLDAVKKDEELVVDAHVEPALDAAFNSPFRKKKAIDSVDDIQKKIDELKAKINKILSKKEKWAADIVQLNKLHGIVDHLESRLSDKKSGKPYTPYNFDSSSHTKEETKKIQLPPHLQEAANRAKELGITFYKKSKDYEIEDVTPKWMFDEVVHLKAVKPVMVKMTLKFDEQSKSDINELFHSSVIKHAINEMIKAINPNLEDCHITNLQVE